VSHCEENAVKPQTGKKYFQSMYLIKDLYLEHIELLKLNHEENKQQKFNSGQVFWRDILPKKVYRYQVSTGPGAHYMDAH
jgi:hypothetical protein